MNPFVAACLFRCRRVWLVGGVWLWIVGGSTVGWGLGIRVNEFQATGTRLQRGSPMAADEYIEFLITAPTTAADLAGLTFGDSNNATSAINSVFSFDQATLEGVLLSAGVSSFLPGTLLVVKGVGLGAQDLGYHPLSATISDHDDWAIELVVGQGFYQEPTAPFNGRMNLNSNAGELVWIAQGVPTNRQDTSGMIDALGVDRRPGALAMQAAAQFGEETLLVGRAANGTSAVVRGREGGPAVLEPGTAGVPGGMGGGSAATIEELRVTAIPEPSRGVLLMIGGLGWVCRRRR